jgi:hypothetical protein
MLAVPWHSGTGPRKYTVNDELGAGDAGRLLPFHYRVVKEVEARQGQCPVGLLSFSVACDHPAADVASGGCSRAATKCVVPLHPRATCLTDLRDHAVRLMKRCGRHCLGGGCDGQRKCDSDQPDHCHLPYEPSKKDFLEEERAPSRRLLSILLFARCYA